MVIPSTIRYFLAYKAQLQHYQQQKQKILGTTGPVVSDTVSDNEDDTDELEHNFSVFECPGWCQKNK